MFVSRCLINVFDGGGLFWVCLFGLCVCVIVL